MPPAIRKTGLFSTLVDGQAVIYDSASRQTHCLNPHALKVWNLCDGRHDRVAMVQALAAEGGLPDGEAGDLVDAALDRFAELELLQGAASLDRRALGATAAKSLAAGLVLSVMMPTRQAAASGDSCSGLSQVACNFLPQCGWVGYCITLPD
ncbi:HPr-rel-A system PqqD family peptide chaperone [Ancylobacter sp. IITR112]|uniref:HPr-rel-A system PqqD family peptide chaperone n=1 Tax=Ancylobacter sp. IITR112 TaxID=3138073 RepID=UPI00352B692D